MSDAFTDAVGLAVRLLSDKTGVQLSAEQVLDVVNRGATLLEALVDDAAKGRAAAAGAERAAKVTDMESAEDAARSRK